MNERKNMKERIIRTIEIATQVFFVTGLALSVLLFLFSSIRVGVLAMVATVLISVAILGPIHERNKKVMKKR
jgi:hypothetical protein